MYDLLIVIFCKLKQASGDLIDLSQFSAPTSQPVTQSTSNPIMSSGLWFLYSVYFFFCILNCFSIVRIFSHIFVISLLSQLQEATMKNLICLPRQEEVPWLSREGGKYSHHYHHQLASKFNFVHAAIKINHLTRDIRSYAERVCVRSFISAQPKTHLMHLLIQSVVTYNRFTGLAFA